MEACKDIVPHMLGVLVLFQALTFAPRLKFWKVYAVKILRAVRFLLLQEALGLPMARLRYQRKQMIVGDGPMVEAMQHLMAQYGVLMPMAE